MAIQLWRCYKLKEKEIPDCDIDTASINIQGCIGRQSTDDFLSFASIVSFVKPICAALSARSESTKIPSWIAGLQAKAELIKSKVENQVKAPGIVSYLCRVIYSQLFLSTYLEDFRESRHFYFLLWMPCALWFHTLRKSYIITILAAMLEAVIAWVFQGSFRHHLVSFLNFSKRLKLVAPPPAASKQLVKHR